jgi:hypothetical protein
VSTSRYAWPPPWPPSPARARLGPRGMPRYGLSSTPRTPRPPSVSSPRSAGLGGLPVRSRTPRAKLVTANLNARDAALHAFEARVAATEAADRAATPMWNKRWVELTDAAAHAEAEREARAWEAVMDRSTGRTYFWNSLSNKTSWNAPVSGVYHEHDEWAKRAREAIAKQACKSRAHAGWSSAGSKMEAAWRTGGLGGGARGRAFARLQAPSAGSEVHHVLLGNMAPPSPPMHTSTAAAVIFPLGSTPETVAEDQRRAAKELEEKLHSMSD